ncbi:Pre-mRNA polyadenylation factor Fip1 domain [Trypanosoma melophagium]|uniref:Pre-mRNA polyadenylation factor Fip1 domain n=1 Tax=Trypanosoma melophagium TaxID=715481 RepID=UPI00351A2E15|nr:Pre-mRNA polyadenylation factor Fip1 domain [Trypanosoma melophagium]
MSESTDNPFVINHVDEPLEPSAAVVEQQQHHHQSYDMREDVHDAIEGKDDVVGLIPLCVRHADGPQMNTAVFGYDIAQMQKRPWEDPAANLKDYFNYGFNENSWRLYCAMQAEGEASLLRRANTFLAQLNNAAMKSVGVGMEDPMNTEGGGGGASYYMLPQGSSHNPYGGAAPRDNFLKTRMCQRFVDGRCTKGDHCSYAHGRGELRVGGPYQQQQQMMPQHPSAYVLPPVCVEQAVLPQMTPTTTTAAGGGGMHDLNSAGTYRMMPKRQRSQDGGEEQQTYDGSY